MQLFLTSVCSLFSVVSSDNIGTFLFFSGSMFLSASRKLKGLLLLLQSKPQLQQLSREAGGKSFGHPSLIPSEFLSSGLHGCIFLLT